MSWWRRVFGLDAFDVAVQAIITGILLFWVAAVNHRDEDIAVFGSLITTGSLLVLAVRRRLALNKGQQLESGRVDADRMAELEQRVAELELDGARLAELEERLDFAERMMARSPVEARQLGPGRSE